VNGDGKRALFQQRLRRAKIVVTDLPSAFSADPVPVLR
jgi:hypothetical protein